MPTKQKSPPTPTKPQTPEFIPLGQLHGACPVVQVMYLVPLFWRRKGFPAGISYGNSFLGVGRCVHLPLSVLRPHLPEPVLVL